MATRLAHLTPSDRAIFATNARLVSCLVTESLLKALYIPIYGFDITGVAVVLLSESNDTQTSYKTKDILTIVALHNVPLLHEPTGASSQEISLLDPLDMLPIIFEVSTEANTSTVIEHADLTTAIMSTLSGQGWDISISTHLFPSRSAVSIWEKFASSIKLDNRLLHEISDELLSSVKWQAYSYEHPPLSPQFTSPSIEWEQSIVEGHPTHPMHKLRYFLPPLADLMPGSVDLYHPRLRLIAIPREKLHITYDFETLAQPVVAAMSRKAQRDIQVRKDFVAIPVHELQIAQIRDKFEEAEIYPEDVHLDILAQQSIRSVIVPEVYSTLSLKLGVGIKLTSAVRTISPASAYLGPRFSKNVVPALFMNPKIVTVAKELASVVSNHADGEIAKHCSAIIREAHELSSEERGERLIVCTALVESGHSGEGAHIPAVIRVFDLDTEEKRIQWLSKFTRMLFDAFLPTMLKNGVAFECHPQNCLARFDLDTKELKGFIIRDFGGLRVHRETLKASTGVDIDVHEGHSIIASDLDDVYTRMYHTIFHNHLQQLIRVLGLHYNGRGWDVVREHLKAVIPRDHPLFAAWLSPERKSLPSKCFLRMRMSGMYRFHLHSPFPNLLHYRGNNNKMIDEKSESATGSRDSLDEKDVPSKEGTTGDEVPNHLDFDLGDEVVRYRTKWWQLWIPRNPPPRPRPSLSDAPTIPLASASLLSVLTYAWVTPMMILGYQRTLQATDLWKIDPTREAGPLSLKFDQSWDRRKAEAEVWNTRLANGDIKPGYLKRFRWTIQALAHGSRYTEQRAAYESLFQLLRQPMMFLPRALSATADARNALSRLKKVFHSELMDDVAFQVDPTQTDALEAIDASFEWEILEGQLNKEQEKAESEEVVTPFKVSNINMRVPRGTLVAVVGRVGSGKSSLLQGLIGEMRHIGGSFSFGGKVAYCPQTAWIQNASLRDNILFGKPYEEERYWRVIEEACLLPDLHLLPNADLTEIGEKGINLSGGQKQRVGLSLMFILFWLTLTHQVNIARALYYDADVVILDDPLSAVTIVDAHVGKALFHGAIVESLRNKGKSVILVTHALHFMSHCDYIYTLDGGRIAEHGTYVDLVAMDGEFARLDREFGGKDSDSSEENSPALATDIAEEMKIRSAKAARGIPGDQLAGKLIVKEVRTTGSVSLNVYLAYYAAGRGYLLLPLMFLIIVLVQGSQILNSYTLVWWQANKFDRPFSFYQILYACLGISQALFTLFLGLAVDTISWYVSRNLHHEAIRNIFLAKMSFFDTTPMGRVLGVFGKDIDNMDNQLPESMRMLIFTLAQLTGSIVIITVVEPYFIIVAVAISFGYQYFAAFYRASAREVKRLDAMLRSILYAHFAESLTGLPTIRSYGEISRFIKENTLYIDLENRALYLTVTTQRRVVFHTRVNKWLAIRIDLCGACLVFVVAIFAVVGIRGISPAEVGLILTYTTSLTQTCGMLTRQTAEVENYMNSVERVVHYTEKERIDQEALHEIPAEAPPADWPQRGAIEFENVEMSYRPGLPKVLHGLSMQIKAGEKIGVVGRTGAGKSSLALTILRLVEYTGSIIIDGIDIGKLGLRDLRSKISIIPQDPTLFSGTVRTALDPFSLYDDTRLWDALRRSFLVESRPTTPNSSDAIENFTGSNKITLDTIIEADGANLSVGERSLLSLARALVKNSRVVILDEATASVDVETDKKIQTTIHNSFSDRTLICIAHRLRTIIHYDRILVMDAGNIAEFDTPANLFKRSDGFFRGLCEKSNITWEDIVGLHISQA
ncbi:hypothetical protein H0H93_012642 [Arthromyces matolae]|nr:hypothetical protein H0H93_012642 [Arthromyces matolae]